MQVCVPANRHAQHRGIYAQGSGCTFLQKGVLPLHAYRHALCQHAHVHRSGKCIICTLVWGSHICMYMPTDIHSWVYIPAWGLGMLTFMIYEHTVSGFSHINMLAYVLTHAHTHTLALCMYLGIGHSSSCGLQIYTWRVCTHVQGSGMLTYTTYDVHTV